MSLRSVNKNGLISLLGGDKDAERAVELLIKYSKKGVIPREELDEELVILFESEKLAFPIKSEKDSLSWGSRFLVVEDLEIPYVIRIVFSEFCSWKEAVKKYFSQIGEKDPEAFVRIVEEVFKKRKYSFITGETLTEISLKYGKEPGAVIAELKGAGVISPFAGCGRSLSKLMKLIGSPVYEINRFLLKMYESL